MIVPLFTDIIKDQLKQRKTISIVDVLKPPSKSLIKNTFLKQQVAKGLAINVLRNREWGGYYSIPYKSESDVGKKDVELTDKVNITTDGSSFVANVDGVQVIYKYFKIYYDIKLIKTKFHFIFSTIRYRSTISHFV